MSVFDEDIFLRPVEGHDDVFAFRYDFGLDLEGKATVTSLQEGTVKEQENGDLIIEGYAAVFEGVDREGENFAPGAFQRGIKSFLESQAALCFHHKPDHVLGKVLNLEEKGDKGLWMRARVDGAIKDHPTLGTIYRQIKSGTLNGLSVGGHFRRAITAAGRKIMDMDFAEISITGVPIHPGTRFAVVAGKALETLEISEEPEVEEDEEIRDEDWVRIETRIAELVDIFNQLKQDQSVSTEPQL